MHPKGFVQKVLLSAIAVGIAINSPAQTVTYTITDLGTLGGTYSTAHDINAAGQVVGVADNSAGVDRAFLYSNGAMQDLNTLLPAGSGWILREASAINNAGEIVGFGKHNGATRAFLLKPGN